MQQEPVGSVATHGVDTRTGAGPIVNELVLELVNDHGDTGVAEFPYDSPTM